MKVKQVETISNRLKKILNIRHINQAELSRLTGIAKSSISLYISGKYEPKSDKIFLFAKALDVSFEWLSGFDVPMAFATSNNKAISSANRGTKIPVLGKVAAGIPIEAVEDIIDYEEINESLLTGGNEYFALQIQGNSMEPRMKTGDVVIVRKQNTAESGDTVVALVNGNSATVKKIKFNPDGIMLIPTNQSHEPMFYNKEEIEKLPVLILGKVIELRAKF